MGDMNHIMSHMNSLGICQIFRRGAIITSTRGVMYLKKIDFAIGFEYEQDCFIILNGKFQGKIIDKNGCAFAVRSFKTFERLYQENNQMFDFKKFMDKYNHHIGTYFELNSSNNMLYEITDPEILQEIKNKDPELLQETKNANKEYDDTVLNNDTDISKMYSAIKKTIVSQDEQIMQILTSLFKNQRVINSSLSDDIIRKLKENIIVYGSTGTGKTEILKQIASIYNIPIVIEDATSLSETGFVGRNITDMLEDLYLESDRDIEKAQKGILVIDEFDKLAEKSDSSQEHVSRAGVQRSLLKLLDGSTFYLGDMKFDTSKISVVVLGAFTGIVNNDDYSKISSSDFVDYGIMRELMGRFSKFIAMNPLSKEDLKRILIESDFSPLNTYKILFESMNINFAYDEDFIDYIAEKASELNSGARSLKTVFDDAVGGAMFKIFAGEYSAIHLTRPINNAKTYTLTK